MVIENRLLINFFASKMYFSGFTEDVQSRLQTAVTITCDHETNPINLVRDVINNEKQQERRRRIVTEPGVIDRKSTRLNSSHVD